jgi:hypothetical protein
MLQATLNTLQWACDIISEKLQNLWISQNRNFISFEQCCGDFAETPHALFQCCHQTHEVDQGSCLYTTSSFHKPSVPPSYVIPAWCVFSKPCTKLTLHCNHRSGHLKTEHTESLLLLRRHVGNWSRDPAVSMRSELLVAHEKLGQNGIK